MNNTEKLYYAKVNGYNKITEIALLSNFPTENRSIDTLSKIIYKELSSQIKKQTEEKIGNISNFESKMEILRVGLSESLSVFTDFQKLRLDLQSGKSSDAVSTLGDIDKKVKDLDLDLKSIFKVISSGDIEKGNQDKIIKQLTSFSGKKGTHQQVSGRLNNIAGALSEFISDRTISTRLSKDLDLLSSKNTGKLRNKRLTNKKTQNILLTTAKSDQILKMRNDKDEGVVLGFSLKAYFSDKDTSFLSNASFANIDWNSQGLSGLYSNLSTIFKRESYSVGKSSPYSTLIAAQFADIAFLGSYVRALFKINIYQKDDAIGVDVDYFYKIFENISTGSMPLPYAVTKYVDKKISKRQDTFNQHTDLDSKEFKSRDLEYRKAKELHNEFLKVKLSVFMPKK